MTHDCALHSEPAPTSRRVHALASTWTINDEHARVVESVGETGDVFRQVLVPVAFDSPIEPSTGRPGDPRTLWVQDRARLEIVKPSGEVIRVAGGRANPTAPLRVLRETAGTVRIEVQGDQLTAVERAE